MKKRNSRFKWIDGIILFILFAKVILFYLVTDSESRLAVSILTVAFVLLIAGTFLLGKKKNSVRSFGIIYTLISVLMFIDSMYFAYFNQLPSVLQLFQVDSMVVVDADTFNITLPPINLFLLLDIPLVIWYFKQLNLRLGDVHYMTAKRWVKTLLIGLVLVMMIGVINPLDANAFKVVTGSELLSYHLRDIYEHVVEETVVADDDALADVFEQLDKRDDTPMAGYESLEGIAKGYNVIVIQVESLQNFPIGRTFEGVTLTPNLNRLLKNNSLYFDRYYQNIGRGNTSDAEFSTNNSLYPVIDGESYKLFETNTFNGLPWILKNQGYTSTAYHGYNGEFWNREAAYPEQGFDDFISLEDFDFTEKVAFGLSDVAMFDQTFEHLERNYEKNPDQPFHSFIVTLSCHYPYLIPEAFQLPLDEEDERYDTLFSRYLSGVRYSDYALGQFMDRLEASEFGDKTIVAIYGDHYGLNAKEEENHKLMSDYLGKDYDYDTMLNIPLIIHIPGLSDVSIPSATVDKVGGQVDFLPTLAYLMGFETDEYTMGQNILSREDGFVASVTYMLHGSFIKQNVMYEASPTEIFEDGRAWNPITGEPILDLEPLRSDYEEAGRRLDASSYLLKNNKVTRP